MANRMDALVIAMITKKARAGHSRIEVPVSLLRECTSEGLTAIKEMRMAWEIEIVVQP